MATNSNQQTTGPSVITSPNADTRTLNHRGTEVGSANVTRTQNTTGSLTEVLKWEMPAKYTEMVLAGGKHWTKAQLRGKETFDGDGSTTTFSMTADLRPIAGEPELDEQPFKVVIAYDTDAASQLTVDSVDYVDNTVTFTSAPNTGTDNVAIWFIIAEGVVQYRAEDAFGHEVGPLDEWGTPLQNFANFNQNKNTSQIHLPGAGRWDTEGSALKMMVDSPRQVVWEDPDYPEGEYVSTVQQRLDVQV